MPQQQMFDPDELQPIVERPLPVDIQEQTLARQISRMDNNRLVALARQSEQLYRQINQSTCWSTLGPTARLDLCRLQERIDQVNTLLQREKAQRILLGIAHQFRNLLCAIQEPIHAPTSPAAPAGESADIRTRFTAFFGATKQM